MTTRQLRIVPALLLVAALLGTAGPLPCAAAPKPAKQAPAPVVTGKKKLLFFAKNPATWKIVKGGGHAKMVYHAASGAFTLTAAGLRPDSAYTLIRFAGEAPKVELLAAGESDRKGGLKLAGTWHDWTKKFWIVPTSDVSGTIGGSGTLTAWRPKFYLFEEKELGIPCNCPEPDEP